MSNKNFVVTDENVKDYVMRIATFIKKNVDTAGMDGVFLGMSSGIDCSVVSRLCQEAGVKITLVLLPDGQDMERSKSKADALELINQFDFDYKIIDIENICNSFENSIDEPLSKLSKMNIRPRTRMTILYALAQSHNCLVMGTGNLAERLLGYFTKWGDGANDLNPLGMLTKGEVRTLARYLKVPDCIINKPPSAGLFEGQTDEGELGFTYDDIDRYILKGTTNDNELDARLAKRILASAHKLNPVSIFEG